MLQSAIHFQSVQISEIFTPRSQVQFLKPDESIREVAKRFEEMKHSRYPILGDRGKIEGFALRADLLEAAARDNFGAQVIAFKRDVFVVPETAKVKHALSYFLKAREHLAVVVDEFGSFAGILTMEDVLEVLTGLQIVDELDEVESYRKRD
ncbi:MAG: CBS domain-containing protein [Opitutales bacterium]